MVPVGVRVDGLMLAIIGVVVVGGVVYFKRQAITQAVKDAAVKVNPTSDQNLAYQGASSVVRNLTDGKDKTVGDWVYRTRKYNPIAWAFEGIGRLTGDL